jgi:hypothetical protein
LNWLCGVQIARVQMQTGTLQPLRRVVEVVTSV